MDESSEKVNASQLRVPCFHATDFHVRVSERDCVILFCRSSFSLDPNAPRVVEPVFVLNMSPQSGNELASLVTGTLDDFNKKASLQLTKQPNVARVPEITNVGYANVGRIEEGCMGLSISRTNEDPGNDFKVGDQLQPTYSSHSLNVADMTE